MKGEIDPNKALLEGVDAGLLVLGEGVKPTIYFHVEKSYQVKREDIPDRLEAFHKALAGLLGQGAKIIEKKIAMEFYSRLGLDFVEHKNWTIIDYINDVQDAAIAVEDTEKSEIVEFFKEMKPGDHSIAFYTKPQDRYSILFTCLKARLDRNEAVIYMTGQESLNEIKQTFKQFGIEVDMLEKTGALHIVDCRNWYVGNRFNLSKVLEFSKKLYDEISSKGFKGLWVMLEMAFLFEKKMVKELLYYERTLHKGLEIPLTVVCVYDRNVVAKEGGGKLFVDLMKTHSSFVFMGQKDSVVKSY